MRVPIPEFFPGVTFFGDASSRDKAYMVLGGFVVGNAEVHAINAQIEAIRIEAGMSSEFHWSDFRGGARKTKAYQSIVDLGFGLTRGPKPRGALHVMIAKFHGYDHRRGGNQNRDTSINRMYFQLCVHRLARLYGHARAIHVRLDAGNDSADITRMRNEICAEAYRASRTEHTRWANECPPNCIRSIQAMDSKSSNIIQMADVILGGIAAKRNGVVHRSAKGQLADYIQQASGFRDWSKNTPLNAKFFTVWNHKSKE